MNKHADAGVGHGQRGGLDQPCIESDDVGNDKEQGPSERGRDERDRPPSPQDQTEQDHGWDHLDHLALDNLRLGRALALR